MGQNLGNLDVVLSRAGICFAVYIDFMTWVNDSRLKIITVVPTKELGRTKHLSIVRYDGMTYICAAHHLRIP